ncbi:MAG: hypothetical protein A2504_06310 [Bdellovibrionales bacterium RIFOXYD12_FULL_39_22]|nr:MAG: hypothetical protein A2385_08630 [Bdellovibrionales bacterium RIFOXYB1_FULL_39_21]OFZ45230.1 MAG: hypothetical protein A2485_05900 [Bdellovibrionales bacterium RIFOXYC12_FULL_39_17]OFZ45578.1 MAG: hypothetical protein A2404_03210 [Bdellovibrionales bacterium RIFOXYC1_FULL_39_130]OFZ77440.1 MAG: hypothetical protein A2560_08800 [Bdellovibrionales bacterium RIFOXYD1_FULL_39_84]OFZ91569.1 MAG: hypothetical protein A2504_06310 [Bdellovibrionales bacterium RIFOXYD12_FULL_39_22]HLE11973.1 50
MKDEIFYTIVVSKMAADITAAKKMAKLTELAMQKFGCNGVEEFSLDEVSIDNIIGADAYAKDVLPANVVERIVESEKYNSSAVKFFFYGTDCEHNVEKFRKYLLQKNFFFQEISTLSSDWNAEWKKHYSPIKISDTLFIIPEWEKSNYPSSGHIFINPGQGFGTGNHETTHLCLQLLDELFLPKNPMVLDFGCGSGILGIAAIKLKAALVDFCDIDRQALDNCKENIALNFELSTLSGSSIVIRPRLNLGKKYTLVFANLLYPIIREEQKILASFVAGGGYLMLSGILNEQVDDTLALFSTSDFKLITHRKRQDWSALLLQKTGAVVL